MQLKLLDRVISAYQDQIDFMYQVSSHTVISCHTMLLTSMSQCNWKGLYRLED
jgi:hypothetical protein